MEKIAFSIMLICGSFYFSAAQIGIGTTTPTAELETAQQTKPELLLLI